MKNQRNQQPQLDWNRPFFQVGQRWGSPRSDQPLNRKTVFETNQELSPKQTGLLGPLLPDVHHRKTKYNNPTFDLDARQIRLQVPDARKCPGQCYIYSILAVLSIHGG